MRTVTWRGTLCERLDLLVALGHHCRCRLDSRSRLVEPCAGHTMLVHDQRALNGLVWIRQLASQLLDEEGIGAP